MNLASDLVRLDVVKDEFKAHLKLILVHNGMGYTTTGKILELSRKPLFRQIQEQALHDRIMQNQQKPDPEDPTYCEPKEKKYQ